MYNSAHKSIDVPHKSKVFINDRMYVQYMGIVMQHAQNVLTKELMYHVP